MTRNRRVVLILLVLAVLVLISVFSISRLEVSEEAEQSGAEAVGTFAAAAPPPPAPSRADVGSASEAPAALAAAVEGQSGAPAPSMTVPAPMARKLVRTVNIDLEVKSTEDVATAVQALANRSGGYVGNVEAQRREGIVYYRITLRVPVEQLDKTLAEIKKMAVRVNHESQAVQDVTDQYVDLDARIRTLQATERELQALLAESRRRGSDVEDIMAVYRELTGIRSQIEQIQGQLKSLEQLAALSTINLALHPVEAAKPVTADEWSPGSTFRVSLRMLITLLRAVGDFAIFAVVVLLPTGVVVWLLVWLLKKARRAKATSREVE